MSNPVFENSPIFGDSRRTGTTPNGYPAYPGYTPGAGTAYAPQQPQTPYGQQVPSPQDLEAAYRMPSAAPADTGRMTYDDVIVRSAMVLGVIVVAAAANWLLFDANVLLTLGGALVGLVLGLVNAFKREPSPGLILAYAVAEGLFLGGISAVFDAAWQGIVMQAVLATMATFVTVLVLFKAKIVRNSPKLMRFALVGLVAYALFSLVNVVLMMTGVSDDPWGLRTGVEILGIPLGVLLGVFGVVLGAICLIMDFDAIQRGVRAGVPNRFAWSAAFGLAVTLVYLYVEFLRLLAILRSE